MTAIYAGKAPIKNETKALSLLRKIGRSALWRVCTFKDDVVDTAAAGLPANKSGWFNVRAVMESYGRGGRLAEQTSQHMQHTVVYLLGAFNRNRGYWEYYSGRVRDDFFPRMKHHLEKKGIHQDLWVASAVELNREALYDEMEVEGCRPESDAEERDAVDGARYLAEHVVQVVLNLNLSAEWANLIRDERIAFAPLSRALEIGGNRASVIGFRP